MASPAEHWQAAARTERLIRLLIGSFTPTRYPTIGISAFFAASNYAKACLHARGLDAWDEAAVYRHLTTTPEFSRAEVLLPYLYLRNCFLDAFYFEQTGPWTREAADAILEQLERLRDVLRPLRGPS